MPTRKPKTPARVRTASKAKPSKKPITRPVTKTTRAIRRTTAHRGPSQGLGVTLGEVSTNQSSSSPGRMSAAGTAPPNPTPPRVVRPEPVTGEEAPREQPTESSPPKPPIRRRR